MKQSTILLLSIIALSFVSHALSSDRFLANDDKRPGNATAPNDGHAPVNVSSNASGHAQPHPRPHSRKADGKKHPEPNHNSNNTNNTHLPPHPRPAGNDSNLNSTDAGARLLANNNATRRRPHGKNHKGRPAKRQHNQNNSNNANNTRLPPPQRPAGNDSNLNNTDAGARLLVDNNTTNGRPQGQNHKGRPAERRSHKNNSHDGNNTQPGAPQNGNNGNANSTDAGARLLADNSSNARPQGQKHHNNGHQGKKATHAIRPQASPRLNDTESARQGGRNARRQGRRPNGGNHTNSTYVADGENGEEDLENTIRLLIAEINKARDQNAQGNARREHGNGRNHAQEHQQAGNHTLAGEDYHSGRSWDFENGEDVLHYWNATNKA